MLDKGMKKKGINLIISHLSKIKLSNIRSINQFWNEIYYKNDKSIVAELQKIVDARTENVWMGNCMNIKIKH